MSPRLLAVHPVLGVREMRRALRFYLGLGFELTFLDADEDPRYACIARDSVELHLQWHDFAGVPPEGDRPVFRFLVDDVDGLFRAWEADGALTPEASGHGPWRHPGDTPWGTREFHVRDPDGNGLQWYSGR